MAKKSNSKNIIIANLPAAAALILMAAALAITLEYNFFISLIVLIVLYFILGVTIEIIMEKTQAKKKRENLFKQFSEGKRSNLPTGRKELFGEIDTEEPVFPADTENEVSVDDLFVAKKPLAEPVKPVTTIEIDDDVDFSGVEDDLVREDETEEFETTDSDVFRNIVIEDDNSSSTWDSLFEEKPVALDIEETPVEETSKEEFTIEDVPTESDLFVESEKEESVVAEEVSSDDDDEEDYEEPSFEGLEDLLDEETAVEEAPEDVQPEIVEEIVESEISEEADETDAEEVPAETEAAFEDGSEFNEELYDALKEMGAVEEIPVDTTPSDEKEARRSLFEGSSFDSQFESGSKPSLVFGSVPDTEDDIGYIPPAAETDSVPKKGKVQVDTQKIDELYAFKKAEKGESFFGRRKK